MFAHQLALDLGGMTVAEMLARMGTREFADWIGFYRWRMRKDVHESRAAAARAAMHQRQARRRGRN